MIHNNLTHLDWSLLLYVPFLIGQILFILKLAATRIQSDVSGITTYWQYIKANVITIAVRIGLQLPIYWFLQHADLLVSEYHYTLPFTVPRGAISCFIVGYFASSILDWFSMLQKVPFVGWAIPNWVKDNIPVYTVNGVAK
jgi:hypothetical protein